MGGAELDCLSLFRGATKVGRNVTAAAMLEARCGFSLQRKLIVSGLRQAETKLLVAIHFKHANGGTARWGFADDLYPLSLEVGVPIVLARMKQDSDFFRFRINPR